MVDVKMYTRDGCRGGRENFKWESLKEQDFKDREQYLGGVMKVGLMGKFGKYYLHDWYAKQRETAESIEDERAEIQKYEEELMQEALGLKPKKLLIARKQLSEEELAEVLKKDSDKRPESGGRELMGGQRKGVLDNNGQEVEAHILYSDARIDGLGFAAHRNAKLEKYKSDVLGTEAKLEGIKGEVKHETIKTEVKNELMTDTETMRLGGSSSSASGAKKEEGDAAVKPEGKVEAEAEIKNEPVAVAPAKRKHEDENPEERKQRKAEKKAKKEKKQKKAEKKAKKKVKKAAKKEKKAAKIAAKLVASRVTGGKARGGRGHSSESSSSSSSS